MPLNTNIALGVQTPQFESPMKMALVANQLRESQMKAQEYEAVAEERNRLRALNPADPDYANQLMRVSPTQGIAYRKSLEEAKSAEATRLKSQTEAFAAKRGIVSGMMRDLSARPDDENIKSHFRDVMESNLFTQQEKADLTARTERLLAIPFEERRPFLASQGASASELKPTMTPQNLGGTVQIMQTPAFGGTASVVPGSVNKVTMTPAQIEQNRIAQDNLRVSQGQLFVAQQRLANEGQGVTYQQDASGNIVALPTKIKPGDVPRGRTVVAPGEGMSPMAGKPSEAAAKETASINQQRAIIKGALDAIDKNPNAFGTARGLAGGALGETFGARAVGETPEETQARSFLFNVVSGVIKERAGTAQSAGEQATLNRFLPTTTDNADELKSKLNGFQDYLKARESAGKKPGGGNPPPSGVDTSNPLLK